MTPDKFLALLRSFRVHQFSCTLDTGDYTRNALMVPVFQVMTHYRNNLSVNFTGEFQLKFLASNNIWRLGKAWLTA